MYLGKYNDNLFLNENNICISTLPSYIYSTICTIYPGWWDVPENIRELRGYNDTHNTKSSQQDDAYAKSREEYCRTVRSSVKSGRSKQSSGVGIKLRYQPGLKDH